MIIQSLLQCFVCVPPLYQDLGFKSLTSQVGIKHLISLPQFPQCQDHKGVPQCVTCFEASIIINNIIFSIVSYSVTQAGQNLGSFCFCLLCSSITDLCHHFLLCNLSFLVAVFLIHEHATLIITYLGKASSSQFCDVW